MAAPVEQVVVLAETVAINQNLTVLTYLLTPMLWTNFPSKLLSASALAKRQSLEVIVLTVTPSDDWYTTRPSLAVGWTVTGCFSAIILCQ